MISYAREQRGADLSLLLQIIQHVTRAPSSADAQTMHATIIYIVAQPLSNCLRSLPKQNPKRNDVEPIISNLKPYIDFPRTAFTPCPELQTWKVSEGGIRGSLKSAFQDLILWGVAGGQQIRPPRYNPRLILISEQILGATATLSVLLEEVKVQTESGNAAVAIDIATAFICAPKSRNSPFFVGWVHSSVPALQARGTKRLNLREALRLQFEDATELIQKDQIMAETVVRLHRAVEAQLDFSVTPMPDAIGGLAPMPSQLSLTSNASVDQAMAFGANNNAASMDLGGATSMNLGGADSMGLGLMGDVKMDGNDDIFGQNSMTNDEYDVFGDLDFNNLDHYQ